LLPGVDRCFHQRSWLSYGSIHCVSSHRLGKHEVCVATIPDAWQEAE